MSDFHDINYTIRLYKCIKKFDNNQLIYLREIFCQMYECNDPMSWTGKNLLHKVFELYANNNLSHKFDENTAEKIIDTVIWFKNSSNVFY